MANGGAFAAALRRLAVSLSLAGRACWRVVQSGPVGDRPDPCHWRAGLSCKLVPLCAVLAHLSGSQLGF